MSAAVLFDLDGVVVDSRVAITTCLNHALAENGATTRPAEDLYGYIGPALADVFAELLSMPRDADEVIACVASYRRIYATESLRLTTLVPGMAVPCLGVLWGIGSDAELNGAGADMLVREPQDLLAHLVP